jgi:hypothetical protein
MYHSKFAAAIKVNGKVLREFKDQVYVPFASEYSVLLKNLNTRRAIVNVYIDGENQTPGGLVIDAGRECNLERSIKNNNLNEGNKFKFIERTSNIENHRGIGVEDGIVRIEFEFEQERPQWYSSNHNTVWNDPGYGTWNNNSTWNGTKHTPTYGVAQGGLATNSVLRGRGTSASLNTVNISAQGAPIADVTNSVAQNVSYNDAGITVAGSKSDQKFRTVSGVYGDGTKHNIVLKLLGETPDNKPVIKEVTVKAKQRCDTCGRQNKHNAKYCVECGTSLKIFA